MRFLDPKKHSGGSITSGMMGSIGKCSRKAPSLHNHIFLSAFVPEGEVNIIGSDVILS
jgi:hypothetical protein